MGRIWICCTFGKQVNWAASPGSPQESKLCVYSAFSVRSWQWCQLLFIPPIASAPCINTGQTALPRPRTAAGVPSHRGYWGGDPGKPLAKHTCNNPKGKPAGPSLLWTSRRMAQSWRTTRVSVVETLPCSSTKSFFCCRKMEILKKGPRLRLILLRQWQPTVWQNTGIRCSTQLSYFDCICHTLVDLQVEGDDELLVFLSHSFALYASAGMNLSTQMQNEWMAFNHFDNVNVIALTE